MMEVERREIDKEEGKEKRNRQRGRQSE